MNSTRDGDVVDGMALTYLPSGLGQASDFEFEWGPVAFVQRVWESQIDEGAWRVDLQVQVLRGENLSDREAMREFLTEYHQKDPGWATDPFGDDGFTAEREVMTLIEPGLAAEVRDPFGTRGIEEVKAVATGLRLIEL